MVGNRLSFLIWRIRALQANVFPPVSPSLLGPVSHLHDQPGTHSHRTSSKQEVWQGQVEVDIYVDYEVNQNYSIKEFINILKNERFWKRHPYYFSAEDNLPEELCRIILYK